MIKEYVHVNHGTCSRSVKIIYDTDTHIIEHIEFLGGCNGNTQGVSRLAEGRKLEEVKDIVRGIKCGPRPTSCPDQLGLAIEDILKTL